MKRTQMELNTYRVSEDGGEYIGIGAHVSVGGGEDNSENGGEDDVEGGGEDSGMCQDIEKKPPRIKRPLNAFMLYMKEMRVKVAAECTIKESAAINQILGRRWHSLDQAEQAKYYEMASREKQLHEQLYGDLSKCGSIYRKRKPKKKFAKRSRDVNSKKCRSRFGILLQNEWCKPCRLKKKCIRYMEVLDVNLNIGAGYGNLIMVGGGNSNIEAGYGNVNMKVGDENLDMKAVDGNLNLEAGDENLNMEAGDGNQSDNNLGSCGSMGDSHTPLENDNDQYSSEVNVASCTKKQSKEYPADPGDSSMKCRARYGPDQRNLWCRPCSSKKKCIRYKAGSGTDCNQSDDNVSSCGSMGDVAAWVMPIVNDGQPRIKEECIQFVKAEDGNYGNEPDDNIDRWDSMGEAAAWTMPILDDNESLNQSMPNPGVLSALISPGVIVPPSSSTGTVSPSVSVASPYTLQSLTPLETYDIKQSSSPPFEPSTYSNSCAD